MVFYLDSVGVFHVKNIVSCVFLFLTCDLRLTALISRQTLLDRESTRSIGAVCGKRSSRIHGSEKDRKQDDLACRRSEPLIRRPTNLSHPWPGEPNFLALVATFIFFLFSASGGCDLQMSHLLWVCFLPHHCPWSPLQSTGILQIVFHCSLLLAVVFSHTYAEPPSDRRLRRLPSPLALFRRDNHSTRGNGCLTYTQNDHRLRRHPEEGPSPHPIMLLLRTPSIAGLTISP